MASSPTRTTDNSPPFQRWSSLRLRDRAVDSICTAFASILILAALLRPVNTTALDYYPITESDRKFLAELVDAVGKNDVKWIAGHMVYPLSLSREGTRMVKTKEEFMPILKRELNETVRAKIAGDARKPLFKNWRGVMVGEGVVWFAEFVEKQNNTPTHWILALGLFAFQPKDFFAPSEGPDNQTLATADLNFSFKLLKELSKEQPGTNIFISPFSASSVLQMVSGGARGQTQSEMQHVLGTAGLSADTLNRANKDFADSLNGRGTNIILTTANAVWYRKGIAVKPEFIKCNQQFFGATVDGLDFADPRSTGIINAWASEKTHGRINGIADGLINPPTELFVANAVYFKGKWETPFDLKLTKDRVFHSRGGRQKKVPMMEQSRRFTYRRGTGYQAVRLEYQDGSLGMYVFLPDTNSSPEKLLSLLSGDTWQRVTEPGFNQREGTVVLPRFKLEYGAELTQPLKALGMRAAFGKADFAGISDQLLFVSAVRQKAFVEVDEEGTEAAAVTGIPGTSGIESNLPKPFQMIVDRPFLFLIEDKQTKLILFMGVVFDPGAAP
jgi:serpin B